MPLRKERDLPDAFLGALGDKVRRLMREATDAFDPIPPRWEELDFDRDPDEPVVALSRDVAVPDQGPDLYHDRPRSRLVGLQRTLLVAAALVLVLMAIGLLTTNDGQQVTQAGQGPTMELPAPGDSTFHPSDAVPVWTSQIDEPVAAAEAYLVDGGISADGTSADPQLTLQPRQGSTAVVDWSAPSGSRTWAGSVYLRMSTDQGQGWDVVGATSNDVDLHQVRRQGDRLSFTLTRTIASADQLAVGLWADGEPVTVGELSEVAPVAVDVPISRGSGAIAPVAVADQTGAERHLSVEVGQATHLELIVYQISGGRVRALSHMAIGQPPKPDRDEAPPTSSPSTAVPAVEDPPEPATDTGSPDVSIEDPPADTGVPEPPPTGDPRFDALAQSCYLGSMEACDALYLMTPTGSEYEGYGDTCGARVSDSRSYYCTEFFPNPAPPAG